MNQSLGDRMKRYESVYNSSILQPRTPVIVRIDGKAFHTYTRRMKKPYECRMVQMFAYTTQLLVDSVQNCVLGYTQSDEISLLLIDYNNFNTDQYFSGDIQKIVSVVASMTTSMFSQLATALDLDNSAYFDARVFTLPKEEVCNYFIWRQKDCERNSINCLAQQHFSQKQLHGLNCGQVKQKLLEEKDICWENETIYFKRGICATKLINWRIPIFSKDRNYIEKFVYIGDEDENSSNTELCV